MAEFDSRQKDLIDAGDKLDNTMQGKGVWAVFVTPATAAWAQNDTIGAGMRIPVGSRILPGSYVKHGAFGASVTMDVGMRRFVDNSTEIDNDGLLDGGDVSAAGVTVMNGALVGELLAYDAEPFATLLSANPTDNAQATFFVHYLPPG